MEPCFQEVSARAENAMLTFRFLCKEGVMKPRGSIEMHDSILGAGCLYGDVRMSSRVVGNPFTWVSWPGCAGRQIHYEAKL